MNIKQKIGQRILAERLAKGLTRKALEELTDDLKQSRISNWERGDRTPGPEEIKQLAKALDTSAAYLMCLTDEKEPKKLPGFGRLIPILDYHQACNPRESIEALKQGQSSEKINFIPVSDELSQKLVNDAFALKIYDESMHPEIRISDILIINPEHVIKPGSIVIAKVNDDKKVIVRRYKQVTLSKELNVIELIAENEHWATQKLENSDGVIQGTVVCVIRNF